jgi:2-keto-4-pentenoate hydratase/2-oxohepta-3-ene-1,7-dioic acid hydratase in catechol pathway
MRLARYRMDGTGPAMIGLVSDDRIAPLEGVDGDHPLGVLAALIADTGSRRSAGLAADASASYPLARAELLAPVARPPKFLAIAVNYHEHAAETNQQAPAFPTFFNKQSTCVNGPFQPIVKPRSTTSLDYEGELGIVIGRRCRRLPVARALEVVAGYLVVNDVSARDWQARAKTMTLGKSFDTHGPMGPVLVTADEVPNPNNLELRTFVNGELRQHASTAEMIVSCAEQLALLSEVFTLEPGDVIATGTPAGVGRGFDPTRYLEHGDVVRVEIDGIGAIENLVVDEPEGLLPLGLE